MDTRHGVSTSKTFRSQSSSCRGDQRSRLPASPRDFPSSLASTCSPDSPDTSQWIEQARCNSQGKEDQAHGSFLMRPEQSNPRRSRRSASRSRSYASNTVRFRTFESPTPACKLTSASRGLEIPLCKPSSLGFAFPFSL